MDGKAIKDSSFHCEPKESEIVVNGQVLDYRDYVYIIMNKPKGVISATEDHVETCVTDLLDEFYQPFSLFPVGRLDKDTVGLLLLTNDGELAHRLLSPQKHVEKTYEAHIDGYVTGADVDAFKQGVELDDGYVTKPAELIIAEAGDISYVRVVITEGKFHQIKRMFASRGHKVVELERVQMGSLVLDEELARGEYRELTEQELSLLQAH